MILNTKIKTPNTLENYEIVRNEANKKGWRYTNEAFGYMWFEKEEKKKRSTNKKPPIEDTILYEENKEFWKRWSDTLKGKYKEFRNARWETHKDYVSPLAEKKLLNIINKHPEKVSLSILEYSIGYKSIVEHQETIDKARLEIKDEVAKREEEIKLKEEKRHASEVQDAKNRRLQKITESGKPQEYWENLAKAELREKGIKEEFMGPMIPATINRLLEEQTNTL